MDHRRYDVLCDDLNARRADQRRRRGLANEVAKKFCAGFAYFLGFPSQSLDDPIVSLCDLDFDGDSVVIRRLEESRPVGEYALPDEQHDWVFAINVRINAENFVGRCSIRICDPNIELRIAHNPDAVFPIVADDGATYQVAFEALYQRFREWLTWRPSSGGPEPTLGFDLRKP
jgi:hypothetical protein